MYQNLNNKTNPWFHQPKPFQIENNEINPHIYQPKMCYPQNPDFKYVSRLKRVNLDKKMEQSILNNKGFIISKHQTTNRYMKDPNSIYSHKFGQTLQDLNPFEDRHRCRCGHNKSRVLLGHVCEICGDKVKYVDDDFGFFGWITLKGEYQLIHPNLFKSIQAFIGSEHFLNIITLKDQKDIDGHSIEVEKPKDEPFYGIGMIAFNQRYDEIMEYYRKKNTTKIHYYQDISNEREHIFTQCIPVFTTLLRPYKIEGKDFDFEGTNKIYNMMCKYASEINNDELRILRERKPKNRLLLELQLKMMELYKEIENICSHKKGVFRGAFGGRYAFTARDVITADTTIRTDEVSLSYFTVTQLLEQTIINILVKSYNISYSEAHNKWFTACIIKDKVVETIILNLIKDSPRGLPILINRNPTIAFGGILQMFIVKLTDSYTMGVPLQILPLLAGDFDGDVLNILYIVNKRFFDVAFRVINPRNSMQISRNDGKMNNDINHYKDLIVNANSLMSIGRDSYSQEQLDAIYRLKAMQ